MAFQNEIDFAQNRFSNAMNLSLRTDINYYYFLIVLKNNSLLE